jgi:hypothetical protein
MAMRVANYEYSEKIGQGAFGTVFKGRNVNTGELVVVKTEPYNVKFSSLKHESTILNLLYSKSCRNVPPTYWYGVNETSQHRVFVMPYYDETLESLVQKSDSSHKTVFQNIMRSAILILKSVHDNYVVHRDIKPANWMIRRDELVLIDFGLATFYVDSNEKHIECPQKTKTHLVGSPKYASWNVHCGEEYSRRDDLMSLVYIGLWFMSRSDDAVFRMNMFEDCALENSELTHPRNQWFKKQKSLEVVLLKASVWPELAKFAEIVYGLSFQERPGYNELSELFARKTI